MEPNEGPMLQEKVLQFHEIFREREGIMANNGQLHQWKKINGIKQFNIISKIFSASHEIIVAFQR